MVNRRPRGVLYSLMQWIIFLEVVQLQLIYNLVVGLATYQSQHRFKPAEVELDDVSVQYPPSMMRKLFSSVPERPLALDSLTLKVGGKEDGELVLLQGPSSSGKTCLMKAIAGMEPVARGNVYSSSKPIFLDLKPKPSDYLGRGKTLHEIMERDLAEFCENGEHAWMQALTFELMGFQDMQANVNTLSPGEHYCLRIALAACQSTWLGSNDISPTETSMFGPILLMDEWMDTETSDTTAKVQLGLRRLARETGGVIISATHKPNLYNEGYFSKLRLRSGKLEEGVCASRK